MLDAVSGKAAGRHSGGAYRDGPRHQPGWPAAVRLQSFRRRRLGDRYGGLRGVARIAAVREPVAAAVTPDGRTVFVADHLP